MKKIIALILALTCLLSFAACKDKGKVEDVKSDAVAGSEGTIAPDSDADIPSAKDDEEEQAKPDDTKADNTEKTEPSPEQKPEEPAIPEDTTPKTVGNILLADFRAKAANSDVLSLAESLVANPVMADIMAGAMEVEPGFLTGFDNNEITGFKSGAVFMPMIGTIPFVGYVFELEDGVDASSFISNLKSSANLRWNICTTADEMVSGSVGNKVFFVMCPTSFEQE